jgi:transposase, IS30 family
MKRYGQLTLEERYQIYTGIKAGWSQASIARFIGRAPSTISRELRRNKYPHQITAQAEHYRPTYAHQMAQRRRDDKGRASRSIKGKLQSLVEQKLFLGWSPEQISGRLWDEQQVRISHETIYQHVLRDTHENNGPLRYCLRFAGYKQHRFKKSSVGAKTRERKNWIDDRPAAANDRAELGHWERDCIVGKHGAGALLTMVDRKSRYLLVRYVEHLDTKHVADATANALAGQRATKTLTNDNGQEFARDEALATRLQLPIYFCEPGSPWQRGSVENANGLIRQYVAKGRDIDQIPPWTPRALEETLNFRPRKTLGYRTPHEVHFKQRVNLMSGPLLRLGLEFSAVF